MRAEPRFFEVVTDRVVNGDRNPAIAARASLLSKTGQAGARAMLAEQCIGEPRNRRSVAPANDWSWRRNKPVFSRSVYLARIQAVPLFPKRVNFWHTHCSEKKSPRELLTRRERKNGLAKHTDHRG